MEDFFKANSPAMRFLTAIFNLIAVNIMFIISSLPVITAGAALTGLIKIVYEILEGEEVFLIRDFTRAYISNFKKATLFWLPYILLWAFLGYDIFLVWNKLEGTSFWMMIPPILILLIISCIAVYAFPLISLFKDTFKNTLKNALFLAIGNLPTTVMILVIHALIIGVLLRVDSFSVILGSLMLFIGISVTALVDSIFVRRTLKRSGFISIDPVKVAEQTAADQEQEED
ncbi:Uncharacterized membrane protein YesL [Ruminococcaceae bacterium KH2T8]|nr:Uncharacterized membrane protein YesL [Ruminococcaceae bacterium KH2T8]